MNITLCAFSPSQIVDKQSLPPSCIAACACPCGIQPPIACLAVLYAAVHAKLYLCTFALHVPLLDVVQLSVRVVDAEDSGSETEQEGGHPSNRPQGSEAMSKSHQTGLAKLPNGLEWLINALGGARRGSKDGSNSQEGLSSAEPAPKFLIFAHHK